MDERREIDAPLTIVSVLVGAILLFAIVLGLEALYRRVEGDETARKIVAESPEELDSLRASQLEVLHEYRWVDRSKGVVAIPIDRAMEIVERESAARR